MDPVLCTLGVLCLWNTDSLEHFFTKQGNPGNGCMGALLQQLAMYHMFSKDSCVFNAPPTLAYCPTSAKQACHYSLSEVLVQKACVRTYEGLCLWSESFCDTDPYVFNTNEEWKCSEARNMLPKHVSTTYKLQARLVVFTYCLTSTLHILTGNKACKFWSWLLWGCVFWVSSRCCADA